MLVAIETADRTPRPTSAFTRKLFSNMRLKWAGEEIPLTPPMLAIAAAGDAADEQNTAAHEAAGSTAEAHPAPHSPPFSPVRESTPERQPETEWVVPNPVSPGTDWRPWPSVPAPRPPTPPAQTLSFEEPLVFGPVPKPAGYVDPDTLDPIIFGPPPRPYDFVDPALEEPVIFGPLPRPANYIEPEDIDNLNSMEDDTILGGFHEETHAGPDDAPTPTADAAGRAEDPALLTSLSAKIDRCMGRIDSLETELGTSKKIMGGAILTLVSRVKKLERTVKQLRTARLVGDAPATEGDVDIQDEVDLDGLSRMASEALGHDQATVPSEDMEEREEEEVPLRRKRSVYRRARTEFHTPAFAQFHAPRSTDVLPQADISESAGPSVGADKGKAPMPDLEIPAEFLAEDAQARQRLEEEQASARLVQQLQAEDLAQADVPLVSEQRAKELDELLLRMTETDWLTLMMQVGTNPALARELLGADVNEDNFIERMTAIKERKKRALADLRYRALKGKPLKHSEVTQMMRNLVKNQWCAAHNDVLKRILLSAQYNLFRPKPAITEPPSKRQRVERASSQPSTVPAATTQPADDHDSAGGSSFHPAGSAPPLSGSVAPTSADSDDSSSPSPVYTDHIPIDVLFEPTSGGIHEFFLASDEDDQIGGLKILSSKSESDDDIEDYIPDSVGAFLKIGRLCVATLRTIIIHLWMLVWTFGGVNLLCQSLHSDDVEDFWRTQDEWVVSSWKLYPRSSVHVLDLTNGKTVYMFVGNVYPIRATLLERMLRHRLTVPPSYCRDVVVAGNVIQTVQAGLRESYECLASAPLIVLYNFGVSACTATPKWFSVSTWLTAKKRVWLTIANGFWCVTQIVDSGLGKDLLKSVVGLHKLPSWMVITFHYSLDEKWLRCCCIFFDSAVHRVHAGSFDAAVASLVSAACVAAAAYFVPAVFQSSCFEKIYLETWFLAESSPSFRGGIFQRLDSAVSCFCGHVLVLLDRA
ncbi:hypothetical protein Tco_0494223 [Tanacetum coccineum]